MGKVAENTLLKVQKKKKKGGIVSQFTLFLGAGHGNKR